MATILSRRTAPETYELFHPQKIVIDDVEYQPQFFDVAEDNELAAIGVYRVDTEAPSGQRWTGEFADDDGVPVAVFEALPLEDMKAARIDAVNARLNAALTGGYTVESGTMSGKVLQTRNLEDRTNWLVSQASYSAAVAGGMGAVEGATFRTADNDTFTVSFNEGLSVLLAMAAWGAACMGNSWALKDAIEAAEDGAALDAIDIEQGWPV